MAAVQPQETFIVDVDSGLTTIDQPASGQIFQAENRHSLLAG